MTEDDYTPFTVATRLCSDLDRGENADVHRGENSDTPETNAAERMAYSGEYMVPTEVARRLERQRDDAREIARLLCARRGTQLEFLPMEDEE